MIGEEIFLLMAVVMTVWNPSEMKEPLGFEYAGRMSHLYRKQKLEQI